MLSSVDLRQDPFLLAPHARAVGPLGGLVAVLEQLHPRLGVAAGQGLDVVLHFQQRPAGLAAVDDRVQRILCLALFVDALKPGSIWHRLHPRLFVFADATSFGRLHMRKFHGEIPLITRLLTHR